MNKQNEADTNNSFSIYCPSERNFKINKGREWGTHTAWFVLIKKEKFCVDVTLYSDINFMEEKTEASWTGFYFCERSLTLSTWIGS